MKGEIPIRPFGVTTLPARKFGSSVALTVLLLALLLGKAGAMTRYVSLNNPAPAPPYTGWAGAATNIQDAIDAADPGDEIVVTNGVYATGGRAVAGRMTNRVAVTKPLTLRSVNGPEVTVIRGYQMPVTRNGGASVRCVYLTNDAVLIGFTLTNGATLNLGDAVQEQSGGGAWCVSSSAVLSNCVLIGNSANYFGGGTYGGSLNNCTITGNSAGRGGGIYAGTLNHCTITGNLALSEGGGAHSATLKDCTITGNSSSLNGGGAAFSTQNDCTITGNSASNGGGTSEGTQTHCIIASNSASSLGGGAYSGTFSNCTITGNLAGWSGGGTYFGTLSRCTIAANSSKNEGGGVSFAWLDNCAITDNSAVKGGGAMVCKLINCTITGNSAFHCGGVSSGILASCIVYYNQATDMTDNHAAASEFLDINYSCTTPLPPRGVGNISDDPQLANSSHISMNSPCRGRGQTQSNVGLDLDGESWANPPSIGCDEFHSGLAIGPITAAITASYTNVATGFLVEFRAQIEGRISASRWEYADGTIVSNQPYSSHAWAAAGDYPVVLRAYNDTHPEGVIATLTVHASANPVQYVALSSTHPLPPYGSWDTAATNIQDAVDAAFPGGLVLVDDGVYETGGRIVVGKMTNRVAITKQVTLRSVNGPAVTLIRGHQVPGTTNGDGAVRCVYLTRGAALVGFSLTNGATSSSGSGSSDIFGGGAWCETARETLSNCTITGNSTAYGGGGSYQGTLNNCTITRNSAQTGGGTLSSSLNNCAITDNSAYFDGGGAFEGILNNCTITANSASRGGGTYEAKLNNCTVTGNNAGDGGGGVFGGTVKNSIVFYNTDRNGASVSYNTVLTFSCVTGGNGSGNISSEPRFVDRNSRDFRLRPDSPCINSGRNTDAPSVTDYDGLPRIVKGTIDIGAYEFQGSGSQISYAWLQQWGLPTDGSADDLDSDGDNLSNFQEWRAGTNPSDPGSVLKLLTPVWDGRDLIVTWRSVSGRSYALENATNLASSDSFQLLAANIAGQNVATTYIHRNAASAGAYFYRVRVE